MKCKLCSFDTDDAVFRKAQKRLKITPLEHLRRHYGYHVAAGQITGDEVKEHLNLNEKES